MKNILKVACFSQSDELWHFLTDSKVWFMLDFVCIVDRADIFVFTSQLLAFRLKFAKRMIILGRQFQCSRWYIVDCRVISVLLQATDRRFHNRLLHIEIETTQSGHNLPSRKRR